MMSSERAANTQARTYLDFNATAPLRPEARAAAIAALDELGNPSSVHADGRRARAIVDKARDQVAALVGAQAAEVVFTSGATEANCWALWGLRKRANGSLAISAAEHDSVRVPAAAIASDFDGREKPLIVPVDRQGVAKTDLLEEHDDNPALLSPAVFALQAANNETGVVQPIAETVATGRERGFEVHCDAVQTAGRIPTDFRELGVATLSVSAHKMGGPKGAGALIIRSGLNLPTLIAGGGQERSRRGGTENVAAIAGFGAAAEAALNDLDATKRMEALRDELETELQRIDPSVTIIGKTAARLPNTSCFAAPGQTAETLVIKLDLAGISVSAGAACSSGKVGQSHVLQAMNVEPELARSAVRVSIGTTTTHDEVRAFLDAWRTIRHQGDLAA